MVICYAGLDCSSRETAYASDTDLSKHASFEADLQAEMESVTNYFSTMSNGALTTEVVEVPGLLVLPDSVGMSAELCNNDSGGGEIDHLGEVMSKIMEYVFLQFPEVSIIGA